MDIRRGKKQASPKKNMSPKKKSPKKKKGPEAPAEATADGGALMEAHDLASLAAASSEAFDLDIDDF